MESVSQSDGKGPERQSDPEVLPLEPADRIIAAARRNFFAYGFARFRMDDLAEELGMSKKTLYRYFDSKEDLIASLLKLKTSAVVTGLEGILDEPGIHFPERARRIVQFMLRELGEIKPVFLRDLRRFAPKQFEWIEEFRRRNVPRIWKRLLDEGVADGAVKPGTDTAFVSQFILVSLQSLLHPDNLERMEMAPADVGGRVIDLLFVGLLTRAGLNEYENKNSSPES